MDFSAVNLGNSRVGRLSRLGMFACFALASGFLVASLAMADAEPAPERFSQTTDFGF